LPKNYNFSILKEFLAMQYCKVNGKHIKGDDVRLQTIAIFIQNPDAKTPDYWNKKKNLNFMPGNSSFKVFEFNSFS
jgi:hypothetical protein